MCCAWLPAMGEAGRHSPPGKRSYCIRSPSGCAQGYPITRKIVWGAYITMNSRALGATKVFAWPDAEIAVMGAEADSSAAFGVPFPAAGQRSLNRALVHAHAEGFLDQVR
jgi:hypothetical protein